MFGQLVDRGIIVSVAFLIICLFGALALLSVPVQMTPGIDKPVISIYTSWPGATPQDIEQEILPFFQAFAYITLGRAVAVAEHLGPFVEFVRLDHRGEFVVVDEMVVDPVDFAGTPGPGGGG